MSEAILINLPCIIKSHVEGGRRMVEVEASSEEVDSEGDLIEQGALLGSAAEFIARGHLDIDHYSEIGRRLGIVNPESYIVGRPVEVKDIGGGRTSVVGEIMRSKDGTFDIKANRYDAFWHSLQSDPPVQWRASIYGFPVAEETIDCREERCDSGARRFHIKGMDWRSLAFTRSPINDSLKGVAKIVTAKAHIEQLLKGWGLDDPLPPAPMPASAASPDLMPIPRTLDELWGQFGRHMSYCRNTTGFNSAYGFKLHFMACCGADPEQADILAHALMHLIRKDRERK